MALYNIAGGVEKLSVYLGLGPFEVQPNWQCPSCASTPSDPICADCRSSWIHELKDLDYSNAYEARLSRTLGVAGLLMGLSGWASNVGLGWFEFGDMIGGMTAAISWHAHHDLWPSIPLALFAVIIFCVSTLAFLSIMTISGFMLVMNPMGKRHWRHMTPQMYALLGLFVLVEVVVIILRVSVMDLFVIVGPMMLGGMGFLAPLCMRKSVEQEERKVDFKDEESV
ncbi:hypothetical protein ONS95_013862 [Cadophora gregata]|uniref:uncharacterized protein n=1 Tax=Cadophora gregata TaxID=51156 RepID=UPI0026DA9D19|nr:uncharacterized protein ONS95_013862 [Cadophora gregata]KAK0113617.1 hypothetical protein ONS96_014472 [Cadophora gregata f. sp. sojae]KAK0114370.1 hypothetical protein ONS95_013862 [Cadophora gregata]